METSKLDYLHIGLPILQIYLHVALTSRALVLFKQIVKLLLVLYSIQFQFLDGLHMTLILGSLRTQIQEIGG